MKKMIPLACAALLSGAAGYAFAQEAQDPPAGPVAPEAVAADAAKNKLQSVMVTGTRANDTETRRNSTAGKMVFGREELDRNGDSNVGEILKRLPGVTMGGAPGRGGGGVRMRGLGSGYTQMLVNGERPPAGFSLESLAPDQVERIEIMRGPVAEFSTRAIAGTINIVLREGYQQKDIQLRVTDSIEQGLHSPDVSLTVPGKIGGVSWLLNASVGVRREHDESFSFDQDVVTATGEVQKEQEVFGMGDRRSTRLHLGPRLSYKFDNGDTLTYQQFLMHGKTDSTTESALVQNIGEVVPEYALSQSVSDSSQTFTRGFGNWVHKFEGGGKVDVKFGVGGGRSKSDSERFHYNAAGQLTDRFVDGDKSSSASASFGGKYTRPAGEGHNLAAGWDVEGGTREQTRVSLGNGLPQFEDSGSDLSADTRRIAAFIQDEWDITQRWSAYFGLRWEGIRTTSTRAGEAVENNTSVFSPVLHTVWRIPGFERDQVRASYTHSYKAPDLNDLIAAPTFSRLNSATRPDRIGNPDLKPELAKGIDLAYEHYLGRNGILSASAFVRNIDNLMRREVTLRQTPLGPRWVSSPANIGSARTSGIELEAKFQLEELMEGAPSIDLRANYSRFWSDVEGIPGPDNRLDQQAAQTANVGMDYRMKDLPLTLGGGFNWTPATHVQTSLTERVTTGPKRQLDLYGLWKFSNDLQLRIAGNNLLGEDYETGRVVTTGGLAQMSFGEARSYRTVSVKLEMKL
ncbi:TonB-dependent receptor plug domain-containing protein [Massilia cavernae]|uniref:TonB-dependent receptor n=1 Tax=Massilia cavernae TaxID=2320864 RepID=A0A418XT78_9BURK|nr:TonB-dependent receptor [Massilia cavernae]RJG15842.1 TonB-dependent receptor [Massilia cavernae]